MKKLAIIIPLFFLVMCASAEEKTVNLAFTGDIIMHIPVKNTAKAHSKKDPATGKSINNNGFDFLFERVKSRLNKSDIVLGNLEFPVSPPYKSKNGIFNCTPDVLDSLKQAGFTMFTIANNHILDQGIDGAVDTMDHLDKYSFPFIGVDRKDNTAIKGKIIEIKNIRIGFLACTGVLNYPMPEHTKKISISWFYKSDVMKKAITELKQKCDFLILAAHTGVEYKRTPEKKDSKLMKEYIDAGVDLVIGHHPHVLQKSEDVTSSDGRKARIFYSLGNFISNQNDKGTKESAIVELQLSKEEGRIKGRYNLLPVRTFKDYRPWKGIRIIQTRIIRDEIKTLTEELENASPEKKKILSGKIAALSIQAESIRKKIFSEESKDKIITSNIEGKESTARVSP